MAGEKRNGQTIWHGSTTCVRGMMQAIQETSSSIYLPPFAVGQATVLVTLLKSH